MPENTTRDLRSKAERDAAKESERRQRAAIAEGSIRRFATAEEIALEVHRGNADGQHDEMPTRDDCPGCKGSPLGGISVRYCTPADCTNPHCSNYDANRADPPEVTHQLIPVPSEWRAFGDFYRQGSA